VAHQGVGLGPEPLPFLRGFFTTCLSWILPSIGSHIIIQLVGLFFDGKPFDFVTNLNSWSFSSARKKVLSDQRSTRDRLCFLRKVDMAKTWPTTSLVVKWNPMKFRMKQLLTLTKPKRGREGWVGVFGCWTESDGVAGRSNLPQKSSCRVFWVHFRTTPPPPLIKNSWISPWLLISVCSLGSLRNGFFYSAYKAPSHISSSVYEPI